MKNLIYLFVFTFLMYSCGGSKKSTSYSSKRSSYKKTEVVKNKKIESIVDYAKTFEGTKYKYGGTTNKGMDCSGLVYTSFKKEEIVLPRTSRAMSTQGKTIPLKNIEIGDLVFFKTNKNRNVVNHVGLVVETDNEIRFIHASTSRGVIVSSLEEKYWNNCFVGVRRIL